MQSSVYIDLLSLRAPTQMLRNLLKTRRPAPTLHFNLTFHRTGSMLPRLALASLHPHGFSARLLTSSAVQKAATWLRNWGFPYQIPQVSAHSNACPAHLPPSSTAPVLQRLPFSLLTLLWFPPSQSSTDLSVASVCFVFREISTAPEFPFLLSPRGELASWQPCVKPLYLDKRILRWS